MNSNTARITAGAALLAAWLYLVVISKADVASLVDFIKYALVGLAGHAITQRGSQT